MTDVNSISSIGRSLRSPQINKCVFCEESLSHTFQGEMTLELSCKDTCHKECYQLMMDEEGVDTIPRCKACGGFARCLNETIHTQVVNEINARDKRSSLYAPFTPLDKVLPDFALEPPPPQHQTIYRSPDLVIDSYEEQDFEAVYNPRVELSSPSEKSENSESNEISLNYLLTVKAPEISERPEVSEAEHKQRSQIVDHVTSTLVDSVINWKMHFPADEKLSDFVTFDYLDITTNGRDWDRVCCYMFSNLLVVVKDNQMIGQIHITNDICNINYREKVLTFNLAKDIIPEISLRCDNAFVTWKWKLYLESADFRKSGGEFAMQLSANAWDQVPEHMVSDEISDFYASVNSRSKIPNNLLVKAIPQTKAVPVNMIVTVNLINRTSMSKIAYKKALKESLRTIKNQLRPIDKLGLIFMGIDGRGRPAEQANFVSCVEATWNGWDSLIDNIEVFSGNMFETFEQEITIISKKCKDILSFMSPSYKSINKLLILNSRTYQESSIRDKKATRETLLDLLNDVSITFVEVSKTYNKVITDVCESAFYKSNTDEETLNIQPGCSIVRFDDFNDLLINMKSIIELYFETVYLPSVTIDLSKVEHTKKYVGISYIEFHGKQIDTSDISSIDYKLECLKPSDMRNIFIKVNFDVASFKDDMSLQRTSGHSDIPLISFQTKWLSKKSSPEVISVRLFDDSLMINSTSLGSMELLSPSSYYQGRQVHSPLVENPLLPPLSSVADINIFRRQIDECLTNSLKKIITSSKAEIRYIIMSTVSMVAEISRSIELDESSYYPDYYDYKKHGDHSWILRSCQMKKFTHQQYVSCWISQLRLIDSLLDNDSREALTKCQDLIYVLL